MDICRQDWSPLCGDVVFIRDVFPLKPGAPKWNKERPKTTIRRYGL